MRPFEPIANGTIKRSNTTSSAGGSLPEDASTVALYNTSATATVYWVCRGGFEADTGPTAVVPVAGGATGGMGIPPGQLIRLSVPRGPKKYAVISSAADGELEITPGEGD